ncbi:metal-dependent transcriptional regulator [Levilactobacillus cerevisiae]|uniref:metal-dependent transcriptional regulator n=1 Tax=Levilactobacillus cerevisiae TaxID=1704076 RepID=UPI000F797E6F|nr:metal-dependent transcriptional regulator [Levilactobacillus cerevisiae]
MSNHQNTYLKIIAECSFARPRVSNKQIIHFANVTPATVTETTRQQQTQGLVNRRRYTGVTLTERGKQVACQLLTTYRLCEVFLDQQLRIPRDQIPEQAWQMADTLTPTTAAALADYLDHPQRSPFGGTLAPDRLLDDQQVTRLSDVPVNATVTLSGYLETANLVAYLDHLQLPLDVPLTITARDDELHLLYLQLPTQREVTINTLVATYLYTIPVAVPAEV